MVDYRDYDFGMIVVKDKEIIADGAKETIKTSMTSKTCLSSDEPYRRTFDGNEYSLELSDIDISERETLKELQKNHVEFPVFLYDLNKQTGKLTLAGTYYGCAIGEISIENINQKLTVKLEPLSMK